MSKRHHVNRRRAYGRRQHELRERRERILVDAFVDDPSDLGGSAGLSAYEAGRAEPGGRLGGQGYLVGD